MYSERDLYVQQITSLLFNKQDYSGINVKDQKRNCRTAGGNDLQSILPSSHEDYSRLARGKDNFRTESSWKILH